MQRVASEHSMAHRTWWKGLWQADLLLLLLSFQVGGGLVQLLLGLATLLAQLLSLLAGSADLHTPLRHHPFCLRDGL